MIEIMRLHLFMGFVAALALGLAASALETGQHAPAFKTVDWKGNPIELAQFQGRKNVLLVFSRYISCAWCQMFIIDLHKNRAEIEKTNTEVLIVVNSMPEVVKEYQPPRDFAFDLLPDKDMNLYRLYGVKLEDRRMTGNVFWQTLRFVRYLGNYNYVKGGLEGDHYQPPACFIIGLDGRVKWQHLGRDVADNPKVDEVLGELKKLK
jgi:peroxiredoxin